MIKRKKKSKITRKIKKFFKKVKIKNLIYLIVILIFCFAIFEIIKFTIFSPKNKIKQIYISEESFKFYYNPNLAKFLQKNLSWKNIFYVKLFYLKNLNKKTKKKFPIVRKIDINRNKNTQTASLDIKYNHPTLIFSDWLRYIWVYKWKWMEINKKSKFLNWKIIYLPKYIQNIKYLSGFFYKIDEETLKDQFDILFTYFTNNISKLDYLPWWNITIVTLSWSKTKILFNNLANIKKQIERYQIIKRNLTWLNKIKYIDLWSNTEKIFVKE